MDFSESKNCLHFKTHFLPQNNSCQKVVLLDILRWCTICKQKKYFLKCAHLYLD